ncbi:MAG TPA: HNH endonuclease signature motif containing protein [Kofleriaceae bacterium]|jgi:hypothetical protein
MQAQEQVVDGENGSPAPKNTASKFYRVTRAASPERAERARVLHERFVHRTTLRAAWDAQECRDIRAAQDLRLWEECGCINLPEYLMRNCGFTRREAIERIRVANALTDLPRLEDRLEAGALSYSSVRELVRVVVAEKQDEWIEHCAGLTSDQVARAVSGHKRGDSPDDLVDPNEHRHTVSFSLRDSTRARFNAAVRELRRVRGHDFFDDDDLFQSITDVLELHGSSEISCDESQAHQPVSVANDNNADADHAEDESATSTATPTTLPGHDATPPGQAAPSLARSEKRNDAISSDTLKAMRKALSRPPVHVWLMTDGRGFKDGVELPPDELATLLCDSVDMGDINDPTAKKRKHLSDRERARTYALHGNMCAIPGCCAEVHLDIEHIQALEDGGKDVPENRLPICRGHHRLKHAGKLKISGVAPYNVTFEFVAPPVQELDN